MEHIEQELNEAKQAPTEAAMQMQQALGEVNAQLQRTKQELDEVKHRRQSIS